MRLWNSLRDITINSDEPWQIMGGFNAILSQEDKRNGGPVRPQEVANLQACIDDLGMGQLPWRGRHFTWCNKRDVDARIYTHIDWAFGNTTWMLQYGNIVDEYVEPWCSDHTPMVVNTGASQIRVKRSFRWLNVVMKLQVFKDLVVSV